MDTSEAQLISLNEEEFTKEQEINSFGITEFNYRRRRYFDDYAASVKFRKKRSVEETIKFIDRQCFELVASSIIDILKNKSPKIKFLKENLFEYTTLEAQMNEIMNTALPTDIIVTPKSLTFVFDVQEPEKSEIA